MKKPGKVKYYSKIYIHMFWDKGGKLEMKLHGDLVL